jgi:hypothetical protein
VTGYWQVGNSMNGRHALERFGLDLAFSANGNIVVAAGSVLGTETAANNATSAASTTTVDRVVRAYRYYQETDEWKQVGQNISIPLGPASVPNENEENLEEEEDDDATTVFLSPNGRFLGIIISSLTISNDGNNSSSWLRIFAIRQEDQNWNATANVGSNNDDDDTIFFWDQNGPDIRVDSPHVVRSASLTDSLVLAYGCYTRGTREDDVAQGDTGMVYVKHLDVHRMDWAVTGTETIEMYAWSVQLVERNENSTTTSTSNAATVGTSSLFLAVGGRWSARTFRYEPDIDVWVQFGFGGLELLTVMAGETDAVLDGGVWISLSAADDSAIPTTITVGQQVLGLGIGLLRTFSYDAATDSWLQWYKDLSESFWRVSRSANGKVLVTSEEDGFYRIASRVRIWDFTVDTSTAGGGGGGEWIQRGDALEVGTVNSRFGYKVALSADGSRLATSAVDALNEQGVVTGKVRVFEQY